MFEIRNATLPSGQKETILIGGPKIVVINKDVRCTDAWIDGEGLIAVPGLIDPHVHFRVPGGEHKEDWEHGSRAAISGGVTTVFDMPNTSPPLTTQKRLEKKKGLVGEQDIDYRFWFGATNYNIHEIEQVAQDPRVIGVKVYMASTTGNLLVENEAVLKKVFATCARNGLVVGVHANNEEWQAVAKALFLQQKTGCKLYLCHLSLPESVELAERAKRKGASVYTEVCPHHLYLTEEHLSCPGPSKNFYKTNPPLRTKGQAERLLAYVFEGLVDTIGSDHAPHTREEKMEKNYEDIPSGVPGVETTVPLIFQFVQDKRLSMERFIRLTSQNAAEIFGLKHKGKLEVGYDADIVLIDPNKEIQFRHQDMKTKCGWTPFIAMRAKGAPKVVISRGKIVKAE